MSKTKRRKQPEQAKRIKVKQPERVGETCKKMHLNVTRRDLKIFNL